MNITLRQLRAFVAVAQLGGFTPAARHLFVTQSALSVMIRELERELRLRLFDRTTRSVELTAAGSEFYPLADKMLEDLRSAVAHSRELAETKRGRVTVAATTLLAANLLPMAIAGYSAAQPGIRIVLRDGVPAGLIPRMVRDGEVDIGIGPAAEREPDLAATPFIVDTLELACATNHPLARKARVAWRDLAGHPFIALGRDNSVRQLIDERLVAAGVVLEPAFEVSFLSTAVGLVNAGLGIAVLPSHARALGQLYAIQFVKLGSPTVRREVRLLTRRDRTPSPAAASFMQFLAAFVREPRQWRQWFSGSTPPRS